MHRTAARSSGALVATGLSHLGRLSWSISRSGTLDVPVPLPTQSRHTLAEKQRETNDLQTQQPTLEADRSCLKPDSTIASGSVSPRQGSLSSSTPLFPQPAVSRVRSPAADACGSIDRPSSDVGQPLQAAPLDTDETSIVPLDTYESAHAQGEATKPALDITDAAMEHDPPSGSIREPQHMRDPATSRVPSSRVGRLLHYGGLAASLGWGMASEAVRRKTVEPTASSRSLLMSEANLERLVAKLAKMRGAALKLGQFLSIQDTKQLPPQLEAILQRVQNSANYMPEWQTERVLVDSLGPDWRAHFGDFDMRPFAAASIGQVHSATLAPDSPLAVRYPELGRLAVKIQFPGVRESISSDLGTLRWLLLASAALPRGLYLDNTLRVLGRELDDECDYVREAECGRRMRDAITKSRLSNHFDVPRVVDELSGPMVLTTEMMSGRPLKDVLDFDQTARDLIGTRVIQLCMHELFVFRLMQTDPNWSNFLYNTTSGKLELIDFGATREYSEAFMSLYEQLLRAAIDEDRAEALRLSHELGYLTGEESETMLDAHLDSLFALATPFRRSSPSPFPFGVLGPPITAKIRAQIPVMLKHRLTPPPDESYSLNRKLSGAFLLCERLGSRVPVQKAWEAVLTK